MESNILLSFNSLSFFLSVLLSLHPFLHFLYFHLFCSVCFFTLFHLFIFIPSFLPLLFFSLLIFPHLFPSFPRVRQFIEMVNGTDSEVRCLGGRSPKSQDSYPGSPRPFSSPSHKASSSQPYLTGTVQHYSHHSQCENFTYLWGEKRQEANKRGNFFLSSPDLSTNIHQLADTISTPMFESVSAAQTKAHHIFFSS